MSGVQEASLDDFAADLVDRALRAGASAAQAQTTATRHLEMQFDNRGVNLARSTENETSSLTAFLDGKRGGATLNGRASDAVEAAVAAALAAAGAGVADEANDVAAAESLAPSRHGPEAPDRAAMAAGVDAFLDRIAERHPLVRTRDCLQSFDDVDAAFANSRGLRQRERRGRYGFSAMFMAKDGLKTTSINFLGLSAFSPFDDPFRCPALERLLQETTLSLDKRPVPHKFEGDVIVTPECLSSLVGSIVSALSGAALFAGTTPYKESRGQAIASPLFSLRNLPRDAAAPGGADFDTYGVPTQNLEVIEKGVLKDYLVDFFFAKKLGVPQTSGATRFVVDSGATPLSEIVAKTKRGIVFARFSGGSPTSNLDFTGIAKNSFYVEDGEIRYALEETMVSGNFQELLKNIHAVSQESVDFGWARYPFLAASGVTVSSK
jgi:PmbA protein